jgi:hypothetical protein
MGSSFFSRKCITGLVAGIVFAVPAMQVGAESILVTKGSKAASLKACVASTNEIRRNHMDYLKHDRDEVVIAGDRTVKFSIAECVDCHTGKDDTGGYLQVNGEDQFCDVCHDKVAVSLDCFQCHRTTPDTRGKKIGSTDLDRLNNHQLNASRNLDSNGSMDLYAHEPAEIQRD